MQSLLSDMGIEPTSADNYNLGKDESNQKQTAKKNPTENAFKSRLLDLQKQAALIETTGKKQRKLQRSKK